MKPYGMPIEKLISLLKADCNVGLSHQEAVHRLAVYGPNQLSESTHESLFIVFFKQFLNPLIAILLLGALINLLSRHFFDAALVFSIALVNALIATVQERKTRTLIDSLKKLIKAEAMVLRDGKKEVIEDQFVVPGDIIILSEGGKVPADARIIKAEQLFIDESMLTGESVSVEKHSEELSGDVPLFDQKNMAFQGTFVLYGSGLAIVTATGLHTQIAQVQKEVESLDAISPLKRDISKISRIFLGVTLVLTIILMFVSFIQKTSLLDMFFTLTALAVAVVPESLPVILTLSLVYGAYTLARKQVLVKNLQAVDTLGRTNIMIIDKTGTLTLNQMMVVSAYGGGKKYDVTGSGYAPEGSISHGGRSIDAGKEKELYFLGAAGALVNRAEIVFDVAQGRSIVKGEPTEAALSVFASKIPVSIDAFEKLFHYQFTADTRYHFGFYEHHDEIILFAVGAPEYVLRLTNQLHDEEIAHVLKQYLDNGLRVVAAVYKTFSRAEYQAINPQEYLKNNQDCQFLGFFAIQDALRNDVKHGIEMVRKSGLRVIMATGDHSQTALYIGRQLGIFKDGDTYLTGSEMFKLTDQELGALLASVTICARVTPADKLRLVNVLHAQPNRPIVSMTGDGVNDVPSLVAADVGIAMGGAGTEVAKNAADVVLLDDSFTSIIEAIEWGRFSYQTIKRVVLYLCATNTGEALLLGSALIAGLSVPLTVVQILFINVVTDGFLDVALIFEKKPPHLINGPVPRSFISWPTLIYILFVGALMAASCLAIFVYYSAHYGLRYSRTMTMVTLCLFQWFNAWNSRAVDRFSFKNLFSNLYLIAATVFVLSLTLAIVYVPWLQELFQLVPLAGIDWMIAIVSASTICSAVYVKRLLRV